MQVGPGGSSSGVGPVKCTDCDKEFATKYQAKKHYLRRHFSGDKPFACTKCHKKRFVVKEDLTMHMKACGNVFICRCGIRLCSLGALKRHCKQFGHEPESLDPKPQTHGMMMTSGLPDNSQGWAAAGDSLPAPCTRNTATHACTSTQHNASHTPHSLSPLLPHLQTSRSSPSSTSSSFSSSSTLRRLRRRQWRRRRRAIRAE